MCGHAPPHGAIRFELLTWPKRPRTSRAQLARPSSGEARALGAERKMALQGEGDPRWVVRERKDGRNVNGWHWEDKDVSTWAQQRIKQLIDRSVCSCRYGDAVVAVQSIDTVEGDATLYNRKGVLKVLYDLKVVGRWSTDAQDEAERAHGEFKLELFDEDPEVVATFDAKAKKDSGAKQQFTRKVAPLIQQQCRIFIREMHEGAGQAVDGLRKPSRKKENDSKRGDEGRVHMLGDGHVHGADGRATIGGDHAVQGGVRGDGGRKGDADERGGEGDVQAAGGGQASGDAMEAGQLGRRSSARGGHCAHWRGGRQDGSGRVRGRGAQEHGIEDGGLLACTDSAGDEGGDGVGKRVAVFVNLKHSGGEHS
ncbi:Activator of Hsp90 ATPase [Gracilaria domingensis]|nr:Activator of Hsp90 ATPase [Gracilaria domingensis]